MNLNWLKNFTGVGSVLGVDIGTASIKMVELETTRDGYRMRNYGILSNYGHFDRLNEVIQTSTMKLFDKEAVRLIKLLQEQLGTSTRRAVVSLPVFSTFTTLVEMPDMSEGEVAQAIQFKAKQYIPLPIAEVTLDWMPVGERKDENGKILKQVLIVAVPTEKIEQHQKIFKEAGLNLVALEVESLSLVRSLIKGDRTPTLIIDVGSYSTTVAIAVDGYLKVSDQIDYAGSHLTQALAKGLNINLRRAEELKKQKGLLGTGAEFELSTIMFPFVDVIIKEAERIKERYESSYGMRIERVILSGGGANLPGLMEYVEKQTTLPTIIASPFLGVEYDTQLAPVIGELGSVLSVALGLAMRELS